MERKKAPNGARLRWVEEALRYEGTDCQLFPFPVGGHGYAELRFGTKTVLAHRYVCQIAHGQPPAGHDAAHSCGNKRCLNKNHLRWATRQENEADKLAHGRHSRGERHGQARLTSQAVLAIRAASTSQSQLAKRFGVCQQTVSQIQRRERWSWLP